MNWNETLNRYKTGQIVTVRIEKIDHAGIHSRINGDVIGYTKRSETTLTRRVVNLHQRFHSGQSLKASIIGFNSKRNSIDLSFRQAEADPWEDFIKSINIGDFIKGDVVLLTESKAIVEIKPGVTGILPRSEMWMRADSVDQILMVDDRVRLQIVRIDEHAKTLLLSARGLFAEEMDSRDQQATFKIEEKLTAAMQVYRWRQTRQLERKYALSDKFRSRFRTLYIIIYDKAVADSLVVMLRSFKIKTELLDIETIAANRPDFEDAIVIIGCLAGDEFLPERFIKIAGSIPMLVIGTAEALASQQVKLKKNMLAGRQLKMPHSTEELIKALNTLADDESLESPKSMQHDVYQPMPKEDLETEQDLRSLLFRIKRLTNASFIVIFQINLNCMETDAYATTLDQLTLSEFDRGHLQFSPISDVIIDGDFVFEEGGGFNFKYMKPLGFFESLVGIHINVIDNWGYGLFFFGMEKGQFNKLEKSMFDFCEMSARAKIEHSKLLEKTINEQKFLLTGKMTSNFMHEIKNQIQSMEYWLEILKTDSLNLNAGKLKGSDETFLARFEQSVDGAIACEKRTRNVEELFLTLLRSGEKQEILLANFLQDFVNTVLPIAAKSGIKISVNAPASLLIRGSLSSLSQVLLNLFLNSLDFIPLVRTNSGEIHVSAFREKSDELSVKIEFRDNGPGVNERNRDKIFELLYTTKNGGSGLGLAIARQLAKEMGGRLSVSETTRLSGVTFQLELPENQEG